MNPSQSFFRPNQMFEPLKMIDTSRTKANVPTVESNLSNCDDLLKMQLLRKKEKYAIDCPLCKSKVMPFRIDFNSVIFVCVNQECSFPFQENLKEFQCPKKELKKTAFQIREKLYKKYNMIDEKHNNMEEAKTSVPEDSLSYAQN